MRKFITKDPLDKGWSGDKKFVVTDESGEKFLLKVSPKEKAEGRKYLFGVLKALEGSGVSMYRAVEQSEDGEAISTLYSWTEGQDARKVIPTLAESEQYAYGLDAGHWLRIIHGIPAIEGLPKWEEHFNAKIDRKIKMYSESPVKFTGADKMIDFINTKRHLLSGRPVTFQHGDYHIGNMVVDNSGELVVIDFDSFDFGDPWEEFNRIVWCAQEAPAMARGMVDGYFGGEVPEEFWSLVALYVVTNQLSSVPWAVPFGEGEIQKMLRQAAQVLDWYDGMTRVVPSWYEKTALI